jgi:GNAT superfamily N-acetyltransferase
VNYYIVDKSLSMQPLSLGTASPMSLRISTDPSDLDIALIHRFLSEQSYWAKGTPLSAVLIDAAQVAFARVVSGSATFANRVDVFVLPEHQGQGFSK